jgi:hypothetical protein
MFLEVEDLARQEDACPERQRAQTVHRDGQLREPFREVCAGTVEETDHRQD